jgi:hypothetical protein
MTSAGGWITRVVALLLPLALIAVAVPHLIDGVAFENAFPVPVYTEMDVAMPRGVYANAANALAHGMQRDGDRAVMQAEAEANAGGARSKVLWDVQRGLEQSPASPRAWMLLAEELSRTDRKRAGEALSVALTLAPNDYYLLARMERDAGYLWDDLSRDARDVAANAAPMLWKFPELRVYIRPVLAMRGGPKMISSGFQYDPEELRALNRWVQEQRLEEVAQ